MRWDRLFADLEDQLASEWEAVRAALDTEAERLRLSRVSLAERLRLLAGRESPAAALAVELADGTTLRGTITGLAADCLALAPADGAPGAIVIPVAAIRGIGVSHDELLRSARPAPAAPSLTGRLSFGFVMRDLVRRRIGVWIHRAGAGALHGTIDRAGADHLDLALHDPGAPRRSDAVRGHRVIPFTAIAWVRVDGSSALR